MKQAVTYVHFESCIHDVLPYPAYNVYYRTICLFWVRLYSILLQVLLSVLLSSMSLARRRCLILTIEKEWKERCVFSLNLCWWHIPFIYMYQCCYFKNACTLLHRKYSCGKVIGNAWMMSRHAYNYMLDCTKLVSTNQMTGLEGLVR